MTLYTRRVVGLLRRRLHSRELAGEFFVAWMARYTYETTAHSLSGVGPPEVHCLAKALLSSG